MNDIFIELQKSKNTFKDFTKWIFNLVDKDNSKFQRIGKAPTMFKLPYLVQYLEYKQVPVLEALCYYNCLSSNMAINHQELVYFMVLQEFKRIEAKKNINYTPF